MSKNVKRGLTPFPAIAARTTGCHAVTTLLCKVSSNSIGKNWCFSIITPISVSCFFVINAGIQDPARRPQNFGRVITLTTKIAKREILSMFWTRFWRMQYVLDMRSSNWTNEHKSGPFSVRSEKKEEKKLWRKKGRCESRAFLLHKKRRLKTL